MPLRAIALNCTLKGGSQPSSTDLMLTQLLGAFRQHDVEGEVLRVADFDVKAGVTSDEGEGDAWPEIRRRIVDSNILILGTPIWLGQPSSICKRVLERLDAFLGETDDKGRMPSYGKVAVAAVVGNEDGAHHVSAEIYQALNDCGFTIPAGAVAYWVGEAMGSVDYKDLPQIPEAIASTHRMVASSTAHLARLLHAHPYPGR